MLQALSRIVSFAALLVGFYAPRALAAIFKGSGSSGTSNTKAGVEEVEKALTGSGVTGEGDFTLLLLKYIRFLLPFLALFAFLGYVYAGVLYLTAFGNDEFYQKSKKILIFSTIGLFVVILSYTVVRFFTVDLVQSISE